VRSCVKLFMDGRTDEYVVGFVHIHVAARVDGQEVLLPDFLDG
jgi:hypothetical protein